MPAHTEYNYALQVWLIAGVVQPCAHPDSMRTHGPCCNANRLKGLTIAAVRDRIERTA